MKIFLPSILAVVIASVLFISVLPKLMNRQIPQNDSVQSTPNTKTFKSSEVMKFSVDLPNEFSAVENLGRVTIKSDSQREIYINQVGTNFENVSAYLKDLQNKNNFTLMNEKIMKINNLEAISGNKGKEKIYFIYTSYDIKTISTTSEELYDDLDQIAQSFRYTP